MRRHLTAPCNRGALMGMASPKHAAPGPKRKSPSPAVNRSSSVQTAAEMPVMRAMLGGVRTELLERIDARFR